LKDTFELGLVDRMALGELEGSYLIGFISFVLLDVFVFPFFCNFVDNFFDDFGAFGVFVSHLYFFDFLLCVRHLSCFPFLLFLLFPFKLLSLWR